MSTTKTRTKTETRTRMETEEVDLYECPGCEQFVEEDELVPLLVDVDAEDADGLGTDLLSDRSQVLCTYCTTATWDYDPDEPRRVRAALETAEATVDVGRRLFWKALPLVIGLVATLLVGSIVFEHMVQAIDAAGTVTETQPAFEQAAEGAESGGGLSLGAWHLLPFILGIVFLNILSHITRP